MRDKVSIVVLAAAVFLPIINACSIAPRRVKWSSLQVQNDAGFEEEQINTGVSHLGGRSLIELRGPKDVPLPKYFVTVDHSKGAGGGYLVGSPLYNKQQRRAATPVPTRRPLEGPRLTMWRIVVMLVILATCCACVCACVWRGDAIPAGISHQDSGRRFKEDYNRPVPPHYRDGKTLDTPQQSLHSIPPPTQQYTKPLDHYPTAFGSRPPADQSPSPLLTHKIPFSQPQSQLGTPLSSDLSPQLTTVPPPYNKTSLIGASVPPSTGHVGSMPPLPPQVGSMEQPFDPLQSRPYIPLPQGTAYSMPPASQSTFAMVGRNYDGVTSQYEWNAAQQGSLHQPFSAPPPPSGLA